MLIGGKREGREIEIASCRYESIVDDARAETNVIINFMQMLPEGLRIQPFKGVTKSIRDMPGEEIKLGDEAIDRELYISAIDVPSAKWLLSFSKVKDVLKLMLEEHQTSYITKRSVSLRRDGLDIKNFDEMIEKSLFISKVFDELLTAPWVYLSQKYQFDELIISSLGLPRVEGVINDFPIRVAINQSKSIELSIRIDLSQACSKDLEICGKQSTLEVQNPVEGYEELNNIVTIGMQSNSSTNAFRDLSLHDKIRSFFSRYPRSSIISSRLRLQINGRNDSMLEFLIHEALGLAQTLREAYKTPATLEDTEENPFREV